MIYFFFVITACGCAALADIEPLCRDQAILRLVLVLPLPLPECKELQMVQSLWSVVDFLLYFILKN